MLRNPTLSQRLEILSQYIDLDTIQNLELNDAYIQRYYKINYLGYALFHSRHGHKHMGITKNGQYKPEDLLFAPKFIGQYISILHAHKILELATGNGATAREIIKEHPNIEITGIDLSPRQLKAAKRKARKLKQYHPILGDYHQLQSFSPETFDVAFVIEALCYSQRKGDVFRQIYRLLRPGGLFIIFDGYATRSRDTYPELEKTALKLTERSMAVPRFDYYGDVIAAAQKSGFKVHTSEDTSTYILPTAQRFENIANFFLDRPWLSKAMVKVTPLPFKTNGVAAYLMAEVIRLEICSYFITVLQKPA